MGGVLQLSMQHPCLKAHGLDSIDGQLAQLNLLLAGQCGGAVAACLVEVRLDGGPVVGHAAVDHLALRQRQINIYFWSIQVGLQDELLCHIC